MPQSRAEERLNLHYDLLREESDAQCGEWMFIDCLSIAWQKHFATVRTPKTTPKMRNRQDTDIGKVYALWKYRRHRNSSNSFQFGCSSMAWWGRSTNLMPRATRTLVTTRRNYVPSKSFDQWDH
eukprot:2899593-Amphidinium_carterae.1